MSTVRPNAEAVAYRGPPLPNVPEDLVVPNVLSLDFDERLWVPQAKVSWARNRRHLVIDGRLVG